MWLLENPMKQYCENSNKTESEEFIVKFINL